MKETSGLKKIISILIVIVMILAIAGIVCFAQTSPSVCVFFVGAFFCFIGVLGIINNGLTLKNSPLLIFPFAGIIIMFSAASFIWDFPILEKIRENMELIVPIVVLVILFCFGAGLFIGTIIFRKRKKEKCTYAVQAQCIDLRKDPEESLYSPVYKYYYNGREYIYESRTSSNAKPPELNGYREIKINPENPDEVWMTNYSIVFSFVGIMLMVISSYILYSLLK